MVEASTHKYEDTSSITHSVIVIIILKLSILLKGQRSPLVYQAVEFIIIKNCQHVYVRSVNTSDLLSLYILVENKL
uniref:Uncharacterized protein n=1 Tax=Octopus bimaculoides TaxID=37653 RepID=A0A0L8HJW6_OCTBM